MEKNHPLFIKINERPSIPFSENPDVTKHFYFSTFRNSFTGRARTPRVGVTQFTPSLRELESHL